MKANMIDQGFQSFVTSLYFIDTTDAIAEAFSSIGGHSVITRPRRWGKTLFLQSIELFCGIQLDKEGNLFKITDPIYFDYPFGVFTNLNVVTQDKLLMDDILYILRRDMELNTSISKQFYYFKQALYPEFSSETLNFDIDKQTQLLENKYLAARNCFSDADYEIFSKQSKEEQKQKISQLISGLKIAKTQAFYCLLKEFGETCRHYQRYPIIFLTFPTGTDEEKSSHEAIIDYSNHMSAAINEQYQKYQIVLELMRKNKELMFLKSKFLAYAYQELNLEQQRQSLFDFAEILHKLYNLKCLVLIDEYESVLIRAERNGYLPTIVSPIQKMLSYTLKNNSDNVSSSFITGITRVARADIFSGLNHLKECTLMDTRFEQCFGFSEGQVQQLVEKCNLHMPADRQIQFSKLKTMYNQYRIGKSSFFNPFSIYQCVSSSVESQHPIYQYFWTQSGSINYLADILSRTEGFENEIDNFLNKELIFIPSRHLDFSCLRLGPDSGNLVSLQNACSFAFHLGYLTLSQKQDSLTKQQEELGYKVFKIPNEEIKDQMIKTLLPIFFQKKWEMNNVTIQGIDTFITELDKIKDFEKAVKNSFLSKLVFRKSMTESDFQAILSGVFHIIRNKYQAFNEQQTSEHKRIDTIYYPIDQTTSVVVLHENKIAKKGNYQQSLDDALWQIFTNRYVENTLPEKTNLPATTHVLIRTLVFYPNLKISKWEMKTEQFLLSFEEARKLLQTQKAFVDVKKPKSTQEKKKRQSFLKERKFSSISELIKSHSLYDPAKKAFSSAQTRGIRPALMAELAIPQASFYSVGFFSSLKPTHYTPPASRKMAISLLNNFQRADHRRIQV